MVVKEFYKERIAHYLDKEERCIKKEKSYPLIRLSLFLLGILLFYFLFAHSILLSSIAILICMIALLIVVKHELNLKAIRIEYSLLKTLNENELKSIDGDISSFEDGREYIDNNHSYSSDLDLFGINSLFQLINRTNFRISKDILSDCLLNACSTEEIIIRQQAITELCPNIEWRQKIFVLGTSIKSIENNIIGLVEWLKPSDKVYVKKGTVLLCYFLTLATLLSIILSFFNFPAFIILLVMIINFFVLYKIKDKVSIAHEIASKNDKVLKAYSKIINEIENESFTAIKLIQLQAKFKSENKKASVSIKKLSAIVENMDTRYMGMLHIIFNFIFFWDIHNLYRLDKWRKSNSNLNQWFQSVGEFEVLSGFANLKFNHPDWCFPAISENYFDLKAVSVGHPLINSTVMVVNDFMMNGSGKVVILTGSNMSGKSTFLRTLGVNYVMAMAGSCVCATEFLFSPITIISIMWVNDSLKDNTSSFHAELKKLASVIKIIERKEKVFLLLDEILKGTNSIDREIGSKAFIKQLIDNQAIGIIATHDLSLTELALDFADNIENYNFNIQIQNEELFFDYKLNKGICKSRNASILMKKMGIKI